MKRIVETQDGGFDAALGEVIVVLCGIYIYSGKLIGVNDDHIELEDAVLVYETGKWTEKGWSDAQPLPGKLWRVMRQAIESWGLASC